MLDQPHFPTPEYAPDRWRNVTRNYGPADVARLAGSLPIRHTLAEHGAQRLWELLHSEDFVPTLGTFTGNQAVQQVKAGLKAIYLSGWQVAADANSSGNMYPDQSLYPVDSVPAVVRRINKALQRADEIQTMERAEGKATTDLDFFVPIIADAEAGFGGSLNAFELMKAMIEAGAAAVHFEDQLASEKKCGHLGGKVLVPTSQFIRTLNAARLASDVMGVPTLIMARTDAEAARLITSDIDPYDEPFVTGERTAEGFYRLKGGLDAAIARGIAYAPYADLIWCETSTPDLAVAKRFAEAIRREHPEQMLAYNCSPSFNWARHMDEAAMAAFQREIAAMGYKYQFITLAGFHNLSLTTFELARAYKADGMAGYSRLQQAEFAAEAHGFSAVRHQREVGTSYFDAVSLAVSGGESATTAMAESTETAQFH
ncbi:isocitrate lyase [Paradevosia shaoguanensis]|uniref:Isocitrate lyase n=1 Tax=Paradevosia shaoguanensis TaxID=1335043 RepID=A0AA41U9R4_9HYPH|nr:isocitrate lyase [Paradevosia shaoguanensis]MCF1741080.1 isocitrate lyase [Paradevosia shaoguanensis]MCI0125563.1 isocitrate lyase [Paradevosia shaoguanensis]